MTTLNDQVSYYFVILFSCENAVCVCRLQFYLLQPLFPVKHLGSHNKIGKNNARN